MDNRRYQIIATLITLGSYLGAVLWVLAYVNTPRYAAKPASKSEEIVVDITAFEAPEPEKPQAKPEPKPEPKPKPKPVEQEEKNPLHPKSRRPEVSRISSPMTTPLWTKRIFLPRPVSRHPHASSPKRSPWMSCYDDRSTPAKRSRKIVEEMEEKSTKAREEGAAVAYSEGVEDAYFAQVQEAMAQGWNPLPRHKGMNAALVLRIDTDGSFRFFVRTTTGDTEFLDRLKKHMQELQQTGLPKPKKRLTVNTNFIAKE